MANSIRLADLPADLVSSAPAPVSGTTPEAGKVFTATKFRIAQSLWRKGVLDWKLEPQQYIAYKRIKEASKEPNNRFVLNASRRWGKTFLLAVLAIEYALMRPNSVILYAASSQKAVKDMILPAFQEIFRDAPDDLKALFKTQTNQYVFSNGSRIKLSGLDGGRLQKLRGITAHMIIVDEAGFIDHLEMAVTAVLFPMTSTTGGQMILASNAPMTPGHEFVQIFTRDAQKSGHYMQQTIYDIPKFTQAQIEKFAEACGGFDSATFKREYLCQFVVDEKNAVVPEWGTYKHSSIRDDVKRPDFFHPLVSIDLGLVDFTAALFGYWHFPMATGVIEDELLLCGVNSEKLVELCTAKELSLWGAEPPKPIQRVADGQAYTLNDIVTVHKYPVGRVAKDNPEAQANAIRLDVQGKRLIIHPRCTNLIGQIEDATWNSSRTSFTRDARNGHFDLVAALQYFIRHVNRHSNPFPPYYQIDVRNSVLKESQYNNKNFDAIKKLWAPKNESKTRETVSLSDIFSRTPHTRRRR